MSIRSETEPKRDSRKATRDVVLAAIAVSLCFGSRIGAQVLPCSAEANVIIARFTTSEFVSAPADIKRVTDAYSNVTQLSPAALDALQRLIIQLAHRPQDVAGIANPRHLIRAISSWTDDITDVPTRIKALDSYLLTLDSYRIDALTLKPGLDLAAESSGSTANLRRVSGASGAAAKAEVFEVLAAKFMEDWLVRNGIYPHGQLEVLSFGQKVDLPRGARVEADNLFQNQQSGGLILLDEKHTAKDRITSVSRDLVKTWVDGLSSDVLERVFVPTNEFPSQGLLNIVNEEMQAANIAADRLQIVLVTIDGF